CQAGNADARLRAEMVELDVDLCDPVQIFSTEADQQCTAKQAAQAGESGRATLGLDTALGSDLEESLMDLLKGLARRDRRPLERGNDHVLRESLFLGRLRDGRGLLL